MLSAWWRSRHVRARCRNRDAGISPAGHPLAGPGASGSRKWASSAAAPARSRVAASSAMTRACCQEMVPDCRAARVNGKVVVRAWETARNEPGRPVTDGQGTRNLRRDCHLLGLDRSLRRCHGPGSVRVFTAARAFKPAICASAAAAPVRISRQSSDNPCNGSPSAESPPEPGSFTTPVSTATAAVMSAYAFATAGFLMYPS